MSVHLVSRSEITDCCWRPLGLLPADDRVTDDPARRTCIRLDPELAHRMAAEYVAMVLFQQGAPTDRVAELSGLGGDQVQALRAADWTQILAEHRRTLNMHTSA